MANRSRTASRLPRGKPRADSQERIRLKKPTLTDARSEKQCALCQAARGTRGNDIFYRDRWYVGLSAWRVLSKGHVLLITRKHRASLHDLTPTEWNRLGPALNQLTARIGRLSTDFNISLNQGRKAGQTIRHVHFHIVPRYTGGTGSLRAGVAWGYDSPRRRVSAEESKEVAQLLAD